MTRVQANNAFDITAGAEGAEGAVFARAVVGPIEVRNWTVTAGATIVAGSFRSRWLLKLRIRHQQAAGDVRVWLQGWPVALRDLTAEAGQGAVDPASVS